MDEEFKQDDNVASEEETKSGISPDLIRGHINTIILRTLYDRDKYGYEIIEEIESKSHGQYSLKQPTLYSALKRLESQGYINAYWKTDEVSNGGRRKYYTLTDSGREITEKNQSEWEYSRTVIDSLISDRNFDFSKPAPTPVDFKILKTSTSRVPSVKDDEEKPREVKYEDESKPEQIIKVEEFSERPAPITERIIIREVPVQTVPVEPVREIYPEPVRQIPVEHVQEQTVQLQPQRQEDPISERERLEQERIRHENYLRLISEPVVATREETPTNPNAEEIDTEKLIYNKKPETERDYKNIIDGLFVRTVRQQPQNVATQSPIREVRVKTRSSVYEDADEKASSDGLIINSSEYVATNSRKKKYNRGVALFKSSLLVAVVMLVEFALSLAFKDTLGVSIAYPIVILTLGVAQILIFGILTTTDFGKSTRKPASHSYLTTTVVLAIIAVLIIFVVSLLMNVNFANVGDVAAKFIIPSLVALNIPLFSTVFFLLSK